MVGDVSSQLILTHTSLTHHAMIVMSSNPSGTVSPKETPSSLNYLNHGVISSNRKVTNCVCVCVCMIKYGLYVGHE